MPSLVILYYILLSHTYFFLIHTQNRLGHVLALATENCLCLDPGFLVLALDVFSASQFVQPAPEVLAEIKATISCNAFCPLILRLELSRYTI